MTVTPTTEFTGLSSFEVPIRRPIAAVALGLFAAIAPQVAAPAYAVSNDQEEFQVTRLVIYDDVVMLPSGKLPSPVTPQGWVATFPERFAQRFPIVAQLFSAFQPFGIAPNYAVSNDQAETQVTRLVIYDDVVLLPYQIPSPVTPHGWEPQPSATERIAKPFPAGAQQFAPWQPRGDLVSTPQGWPAMALERFARPFAVNLQHFGEYPQRGNVPTAATAQGWVSVFPERFSLKFPVTGQLFAFMQWRQTPASISAQPSLIGTKTAAPSLRGMNTNPSLSGRIG